ncbi:MAG: hypothetical protein PHE27_01985 [Alphaproteobacteria bacterium]|nr:hypothetical protein [Alphaproteobacteria bacterium]
MSGLPPSSNIGRATAFVLGLVVFFCVMMIGGTGYLKYRLDRAEAAMATVESAPADSQNPYTRLKKEWGYGGFLGLAQKYVFTHDASGIAEMKERIKAANEIVASLPEKPSQDVKQELTSIATLFSATMDKIAAPAGEVLSNEVVATDLAPLYSALTVLDAHESSGNEGARTEAQNQAQFWGMLLTLVSWFSLIVAAGCATGVYLILRDRRSAPMRALAQSIQNMAHGDMRTAVWGIERQDMVGELARAIDLARYHFSHLPDLSLMSEQGPVRMRFEGGSRSLFEAMMKALSTDSETIREQAVALASSVKQQKEAIVALSGKVENILRDIEQRGQNGDKQIAKAIKEMVGGAENLKNAHAHTADQLTRLIPVIQERAKGLGEITQITGKQLSSTLQSLASSDISLKANAEQTKETLTKLSSTADSLSERLFGAINLLQASGKVLNETTDSIKSRWDDDALDHKIGGRLDDIMDRIDGLQTKLDAQADSQFGLAKALEETSMHSDETSDALRTSMLESLNGQISAITDRLGALQEKLDAQADSQFGLARALEEKSGEPSDGNWRPVLEALNGQIAQVVDQLGVLQNKLNERLETAPAPAAAPAAPSGAELSAIGDKISQLAELDGRVAVFVSALPGDLRQALREEIQVIPGLTNIEELQGRVDKLNAALAVSPHYARMIQEVGAELTKRIDEQRALLETKLVALEKLADEVSHGQGQAQKPESTIPEAIQKQFLDQWFQMSAQIEASRASMIESLSEQLKDLEARLGQRPAVQTKSAADYTLQLQIEKQTEILSELVNTLSLLDTHMQELREDAKTKTNVA